MNRDALEKKVLLAESGELSEPERRSLEAQLAADPAAGAWAAEARRLMELGREALPAGAPSAAVLANIRAVAQTHASHARETAPLPFPSVWLRGLAYAAAVALAVGAWLWQGPHGQVDPIAQMHAIVAMSNTETTATPSMPAESADEETRLRALAQELLALEGLALDESSVDFLPGEEAPVAEDPAPRADGTPPAGNMA